jgi:hypothetical protein
VSLGPARNDIKLYGRQSRFIKQAMMKRPPALLVRSAGDVEVLLLLCLSRVRVAQSAPLLPLLLPLLAQGRQL